MCTEIIFSLSKCACSCTMSTVRIIDKGENMSCEQNTKYYEAASDWLDELVSNDFRLIYERAPTEEEF